MHAHTLQEYIGFVQGPPGCTTAKHLKAWQRILAVSANIFYLYSVLYYYIVFKNCKKTFDFLIK